MRFLRLLLLVAFTPCLVPLHAQDSDVATGPGLIPQIPGPQCHFTTDWDTGSPSLCTQAQLDRWLGDIQHWRTEERFRMGYDGAQYERPELLWTQTSFIQPQMMVHDRYF